MLLVYRLLGTKAGGIPDKLPLLVDAIATYFWIPTCIFPLVLNAIAPGHQLVSTRYVSEVDPETDIKLPREEALAPQKLFPLKLGRSNSNDRLSNRLPSYLTDQFCLLAMKSGDR